MRVLILAASAALSLAACGNNDQADNTMNVDENLTAENIVANDVTAIDAVTADAADMAADVDINFTEEFTPGDANAVGARTPSKTPPGKTAPRPRRPTPPPPEEATEAPATNADGNATD